MNIVDGIKVEGLDITNEGYIQDFLGFNIYKVGSETYHLSQKQLTNQIISNLGL